MFANQKSKLFFQSFTNQIAIEVKRYIVKPALLIIIKWSVVLKAF
ncbi:Hypothetical protein ACI5QL_04054 [Bacillus velezensis]